MYQLVDKNVMGGFEEPNPVFWQGAMTVLANSVFVMIYKT